MLYDMFRIDLLDNDIAVRKIEYNVHRKQNVSVFAEREGERGHTSVDRRWGAAFRAGDHLYTHGGWNDTGVLSDLIQFDMRSEQWRTIETRNTPQARRWHTINEIADGQMLIFGGYDGDSSHPVDQPMILDVAQASWREPHFAGNVPTPRNRSAPHAERTR